EPPSLFFIVLRDYLDAGFRRFVDTFHYALQDRIEEQLPHVHVPTLIVRGGRDIVVPQHWVEAATQLLPQGWLVVIPVAAHDVNYSAAQELVRVILPFLGGAE